MIFSENNKPTVDEFSLLMKKTDSILNSEALHNQKYFQNRKWDELEKDVFYALNDSAKNTKFENTIQLISGSSFPDIVAGNYYGVEVKSTKQDKWTSIGSSILESTRLKNIDRIFLTFGKLGSPVSFKSRPYEECMSGISVTHYPRYQIDMELSKGQTIFDKMGISYDLLKDMDNPVAPVSAYYKSLLKPGESLWWAGDADLEEKSVPMNIRLWSALNSNEKRTLTAISYAMFPEICSSSNSNKYQRLALWFVTQFGVVNTNIRDQFSAGGKVSVPTPIGVFKNLPACYGRIADFKDIIAFHILGADESMLKESWDTQEIKENRILQWCELVASVSPSEVGYSMAMRFLKSIFSLS